MRLRLLGTSPATKVRAAGLLLFLAVSVANAQYSFDLDDLEEGEHIRYFGSVKDVNGKVVSGATIMLAASGFGSFVFVTDELGRFRGHLPLEAVADEVVATCSKTGFTFVRITKRPGPKGAVPTVQVDCVLSQSTT